MNLTIGPQLKTEDDANNNDKDPQGHYLKNKMQVHRAFFQGDPRIIFFFPALHLCTGQLVNDI